MSGTRPCRDEPPDSFGCVRGLDRRTSRGLGKLAVAG
jgi:hypothetical protein